MAQMASEPAGSPRLRGERGTCPKCREACQLSRAGTAPRTGTTPSRATRPLDGRNADSDELDYISEGHHIRYQLAELPPHGYRHRHAGH
jgi:hypothetical protein